MNCPKCDAVMAVSFVATQPAGAIVDGRPGDPFQQPQLVNGIFCAVLHACPVHGEFGIGPEGQVAVAEPETWVTGPSGERLFQR